ncbi:hypothetical protein EJ08DRAFT_729076 [Tothia fuscella]|uniref:Endoplasmic reticulum lectin n=1 Tax=Tothia fuscella TaxID=1048955 RepID=A0A9P4P1M1_9PEZI|nr:hypothetical protein EJ08DRAFT_729076 [Tothia fuscella]
MRNFWALPAFIRIAIASQHQFSVFDDLLAFPQYEIVYSDVVVSEDYAESALSAAAHASSTAPIEPHPTPDTSLHRAYEKHSHLDPDLKLDDEISSYEIMMINGQRYLCSIPRIPPEESQPPVNETSHEEEEKELARAETRGWELIKGLEENCLYFFSGWWSYSFCHGEGVRQFHQLPPGRGVPLGSPPVEDNNVQSYVLGKFEGAPKGGERKTLDGEMKRERISGQEMREQGLARLETKGEARYLVQKLKGGTTCDLTGKERRIEVQFHCQPNNVDRITLIKEVATCQYLMVISTPRLCNDIAFLPPEKTKPHAIGCTPVMPATAIPSYLAAQETKAAEIDDQLDADLIQVLHEIEALVPPRKKTQIVGDIEIGGHAVVPKGKKIAKSVAVGGGKETLVATIAKSGGFLASEKELHAKGIKVTNKEVEGVKKEVERVAAGKPWRLDVVDTPRGKELRGVIEAEEKKKVGKDSEETAVDEATSGGKEEDTGEDATEEGSEERYKEEL